MEAIMRVLGVIPARFSSTRFPGKMLAKIMGKPIVLWTYDGAAASALLDHIIIATDDERIADIAESHGADVIMTSPACRNGTERVAEVAKKLHLYDIVVNIQGDEPLISAGIIDALVEDIESHPEAGISTAMVPVSSERQWRSSDIVKVVTDRNGFALYFSRAPIPGKRNNTISPRRHIGIYVYRWENLLRISRLSTTPLEREEGLEQLRALEYGIKIHCLEIPEAANLIGIDRPQDLKRAEKAIRRR
ncbi:3-deoxy-manno-octulosonate cytidylyltransferase [bacterium]|nr:MAG: 3-deoxy-manno-octulosonate cytidylyltransferase [bacterium]